MSKDRPNTPKPFTFQAAIDKLDAFTSKNLSGNTSHEKTKDLMTKFLKPKITDRKKDKKKENNEERTELLRVIHILNSHLLLIDKLNKRTGREQKLVTSALASIERFNAVIEKAAIAPLSLSQRIANFLSGDVKNSILRNLPLIRIPEPGTKKIGAEKHLKKPSLRPLSPYVSNSLAKVAPLSQTMVPASPLPFPSIPYLSRQALELFYMKVISLTESQGLLSYAEARKAVKRAQLHCQIEEDPNYCLASCTLEPFPGQTIQVTGLFKKDPHSHEFTLPESKSFELTYASHQSGFPHPLQHAGWALVDLLPPYPLAFDTLPFFHLLHLRKQQIAKKMQVEDELIKKAKNLIDLKRKAFDENKTEILTLHQQISELLAGKPCSEIDNFFERIKSIHQPYDYLAETYTLMQDLFIQQPYHKLQNFWLESQIEQQASHPVDYDFYQQFLEKEIHKTALELQSQEQSSLSELEKSSLKYLLKLGPLLAISSLNILLQHFSEIVIFDPPALSSNEKTLLTLAVHQMEVFLNELESPFLPDSYHKKLPHLLEKEIEILRTSASHPIVEELNAYFKKRF